MKWRFYTVLLLIVPVVPWLTLLLLLPRLLLLKALLVKEEAALSPPYYCCLLSLARNHQQRTIVSSNLREPVVAHYYCSSSLLLFLSNPQEPVVLLPFFYPWIFPQRTEYKVVSNRFFWWTLLTFAMSVTEELWVLPFAPSTIISSSPSAPSRLTLHPELHAYRHSSVGTGFGYLFLVVYLLTIKTGFAFPAGRFRF